MSAGQRGLVGRLLASGTARQGYVTVTDQGLVSGTSFLTTYVMAGATTPVEFGAFALATGVLLFSASLQYAVVTGPLGIVGAKLDQAAYRAYLGSSAGLQLAFAAVMATSVLILGILFGTAALGTPLVMALVPAVFFWQLQEFARRALYTRGQVGSALRNDAVTYLGQILLLLALVASGRLDGSSMLLAIAASSAAGTIFGAWQLRGESFAVAAPGPALQRNWSFGRWLLAARMTEWASENLFPFLAGGLLGLAAPGVLRALQLVVAPAYVLALALEALLIPKSAGIYERGGYLALGAMIRRVYLVSLPVAFGYLGLVAVFAGPILRVLYDDKYDEYGGLLMLTALASALSFVRGPVSMGLRAKEVTRPLFLGFLLSTIATFTVGVWLISTQGLWGVAFGGILNAVIQNVVLWAAWLRSPRAPGTEQQHAPDQSIASRT